MTACTFCNGSGYFAGTYGDIECVECSGEGTWDDVPETCSICRYVLSDGVCAVCDAHLVEVERLKPRDGYAFGVAA